MHRIAGVVLCGGRSSRMGADKARLNYRGLPLSEHMSGLLRLAGIDEVFSSGPEGIPDREPGLGPLGGLHACAEALAEKFSHAVFVPVDMPLLNLQRLRLLAVSSSTAEALHYSGQIFPLRLSLAPRTRALLANRLAQTAHGGRSIKDLLRALESQALPLPERDLASFTNVNTPQEWQALHERLLRGEMPA